MGIRLTTQEDKVALFCSTSGFAFGPVFDRVGEAEDFLAFAEARLNKDLRIATDQELEEVYASFLKEYPSWV